ncbi:hypothetical protein PIROE2DRAFT_15768 [Piromyces sp. E2]|nr:hypothetical protein PIROE2DRAFT_15768 [Piromyces sp. E2]|eukprot:OUM58868.1 hypothetical protein PIROE2DRAFT_15768 [Piromyces sp. E2]
MEEMNKNDQLIPHQNLLIKFHLINDDEILLKFGCNNFYIDKSLLIKEFIDYSPKNVCVTRPSNYGKSTNLIMLRDFFQMNYENEVNSENKKLFEQLNIAKEVDKNGKKYIDNYLGKYPVEMNMPKLLIILNINIFISSSFSNSIATTSSSTIADTITSVDASSAFITNINDNIVNIYNSSSVLHINSNNYNYDNSTIKCYNLFCIKEFIENMRKSNMFFKVFKNFDYLLIKDINYLLQNGYIKDNFIDVDMSSKNNINNKLEHFIWKLLIESGYLIFDYANKGLKIRNKAMEIFIKEKFFEWKNCLYNKYRDIINSFIINFDEEKIKEFLEDTVKNIINQNIFLDRYYDIIVALLSLNNKYIVITKNNSNERHDIRELLVVNKKYLDIFKNSNSSSNIKNDNSNSIENTNDKINNSNSNDNKDKDNRSERKNYSYIIYITIKCIIEPNRIENGCILALEDNENFKFDDKELKNLYDKIIKFGIAFYNNHCDVNYDINYGINFKRIEMSKELYSVYF